jgi:ribosomal protein S12 methylthiotransferase
VDDALLDSMADEDKVCKYIDMPLQHSVRRILGLMGRGGSRSFFEKRIRRIRRVIPDVTLRTTFIVGFPSETAADFRDLEAFVRDMEFDRLGVFAYSREEGTPAALIKGQVPKRVKTARYERIMEVQSAISLKKNRALVGRRLQALVDEQDAGVAIARLQSHAPDIDGVVFIESPDLKKGDFVPVEITEAYDYDLKARVVR